ncbi:MAG: tape measure protein [Gammaproteobacteria bacterium]|nr:tape measure protein [Gammaproteobacteria bacterium]
MANQSDKEFLIRVRADIKQALGDLKKLPSEISKTTTESKRAGEGIDSMDRGLQNLTRAALAYISVKSATYLIKEADAFNVLNVRIKTATKDTGDYVEMQRKLYDITQNNGVEFSTTVSLFQNLARSSQELQATNAEMLKLTNLVEQLGVISGASKSAQQSGLLQFSQGLSAGVFRAEEFNSLLENLPELANRIAKGLGKTPGELRKAIVEGEVLSKDVFDALIKQSEDINQQFKEIPDSVERSGTKMSTSFSRMLSVLDQASGTTQLIAEAFNRAAANMDYISERLSEDELDKITRQRREAGDAYTQAISDGFDKSSQKVQTLLKWIDTLDSKIKQLNETKIKETDSGGEGSEKLEKIEVNEDQKDIDKLIEALKKQRDEFGKTKEEIALYKLELMGASPEEIELAKAIAATTQAKRDHDEAMKKDARNQEAINNLIKSLKEERDTFGQTEDQIELYKLQLMGATPEEIKLASAIVATTQAKRDHDEAMQEGKRVYEETRTEQEKLTATVARLNDLYLKGAFGAVGSAEAMEVLVRGVKDAEAGFDDLQNKGEETFAGLESAIRGWGSQFTNTLADMVQQGKLDFSSLADSILNDLLRIAIQQSITTPFLESEMMSSFFHSGGVVGSGAGTTRPVNPFVFAGAQRFHSGGYPGLRADEVPAILQKGELVLTKEQQAGIAGGGTGGGGSTRVEIINKGAPVEATQASSSSDINGQVISIVLDDINRNGKIRSAIKTVSNT